MFSNFRLASGATGGRFSRLRWHLLKLNLHQKLPSWHPGQSRTIEETAYVRQVTHSHWARIPPIEDHSIEDWLQIWGKQDEFNSKESLPSLQSQVDGVDARLGKMRATLDLALAFFVSVAANQLEVEGRLQASQAFPGQAGQNYMANSIPGSEDHENILHVLQMIDMIMAFGMDRSMFPIQIGKGLWCTGWLSSWIKPVHGCPSEEQDREISNSHPGFGTEEKQQKLK